MLFLESKPKGGGGGGEGRRLSSLLSSYFSLFSSLLHYYFAWHLRSVIFSGLALLQKHGQPCKSYECFPEAPVKNLQVAAAFHKFAEAAYTVSWYIILSEYIFHNFMVNLSKALQVQGPLLDFGRNPFVFPCAWLYRQGVLTPWTRNRLSIWRRISLVVHDYLNSMIRNILVKSSRYKTSVNALFVYQIFILCKFTQSYVSHGADICMHYLFISNN